MHQCLEKQNKRNIHWCLPWYQKNVWWNTNGGNKWQIFLIIEISAMCLLCVWKHNTTYGGWRKSIASIVRPHFLFILICNMFIVWLHISWLKFIDSLMSIVLKCVTFFMHLKSKMLKQEFFHWLCAHGFNDFVSSVQIFI